MRGDGRDDARSGGMGDVGGGFRGERGQIGEIVGPERRRGGGRERVGVIG